MKLKEYIQENKRAFDSEKMSSSSDLAFEKLLKAKLHRPKKLKVVYLKYLTVAASIVLFFSAFLWWNNHEEFSKENKNAK